jgi:hypothetical protein
MSGYRDESDPGEVDPAARFAVNTMFCPGCRRATPDPVEQCPACGYSGASAVDKFPFAAPALDRFIDPDNHLAVEDCEKIDRALNELEKEYPQVRFSFCLVDLAEATDPREFGFWMMNASPVRGPVEERLRPWSVLLLVDHAYCRVSVTAGYAIEPFLDEEEWRSLLRLEERYFREGDYGSAILRFVKGSAHVLREAEKRVRRELSGRRRRRKEARW